MSLRQVVANPLVCLGCSNHDCTDDLLNLSKSAMCQNLAHMKPSTVPKIRCRTPRLGSAPLGASFCYWRCSLSASERHK